MHYSDYLREQAAKYRQLAEAAEDAFVKQEFLELAAVCEEVATAGQVDNHNNGAPLCSACRTTVAKAIRSIS
jgi:hypothetical protein